MTREVRLLTPIFAIVAIIAVNLPMRTLAYEAAKLPAVSNEVLTTEISAAQKKYQQAKPSGGGSHKVNKVSGHKSAKSSGGHKSAKTSSGGHKSQVSSGGHKSNKFSSGGHTRATSSARAETRTSINSVRAGITSINSARAAATSTSSARAATLTSTSTSSAMDQARTSTSTSLAADRASYPNRTTSTSTNTSPRSRSIADPIAIGRTAAGRPLPPSRHWRPSRLPASRFIPTAMSPSHNLIAAAGCLTAAA